MPLNLKSTRERVLRDGKTRVALSRSPQPQQISLQRISHSPPVSSPPLTPPTNGHRDSELEQVVREVQRMLAHETERVTALLAEAKQLKTQQLQRRHDTLKQELKLAKRKQTSLEEQLSMNERENSRNSADQAARAWQAEQAQVEADTLRQTLTAERKVHEKLQRELDQSRKNQADLTRELEREQKERRRLAEHQDTSGQRLREANQRGEQAWQELESLRSQLDFQSDTTAQLKARTEASCKAAAVRNLRLILVRATKGKA